MIQGVAQRGILHALIVLAPCIFFFQDYETDKIVSNPRLATILFNFKIVHPVSTPFPVIPQNKSTHEHTKL